MKGRVRIAIGILIGISFGLPLSAADFKEGEVIVKFKHVQGMYKSAAGESSSRAFAVGVDDTMAAVADLKERNDIEYVEPNYIIEAEETPADWPYTETQWQDVALSQAWDFLDSSGPGDRVIIAVVDSGVDLDHPDLIDIMTTGYDFANDDAEPEDDAGHGTRVCGIIGALGDNGIGVAGVAWNTNVEIMPLKFMKVNSGKTTGSVSDAVNAIYYAVDNGASVINASWGFTSYSYALADAIQYAMDRGVLFVASAGNSGQDNDVKDHYPSNYTHDNVIAVAAMDGTGVLASFSNYGQISVDIAAPGVGLSTTDMNDGYVSYVSGTSYATPFVAAVAAMVKSQNTALVSGDIRSIILNSVATSKAAGFDSLSTGGCVNAYQALVAEQGYAPSSSSSSSSDSSEQATADGGGGGGGGGGGCMIDTCSNSASPIVIFMILITAVLFQMSYKRQLG